MTERPIRTDELVDSLRNPAAGAYASFEGWIRNHNDGLDVKRLEYEVYAPLCVSEGTKIIEEAHARWSILHAECVHRSGSLEIGECAVWVGVTSVHRDEAFDACRYIIDQVKVRLPIWKKEHYADGDSGWVNCERCGAHDGEHGHQHDGRKGHAR
ncbi:MAG: molybdenum cofactor biosynthesis protein MoaE [Gammaproteobacteria bacterium]|nr:molybdenum cofactor biosynthesis protein MoaE [Gammaproteobacteria bacterium]MDH4313845.1 molybdenum cofactor biosynthesis protein MoaE [Gammaproteobacteria bacterium]MDH5213677.1 molybdenum cofactor biosynthesis protein MoaE [Gammaproteobacteria bacterium]MDH5500889.1 molybdenum cofactor biosynthesis protein MoaE [Gammaproteobacteria bacterium]